MKKRHYWGVGYGSVGCLYDSTAGPYDSLREAAQEVTAQYNQAVDNLCDEDGNLPEGVEWAPGLQNVIDRRGLEDPRPDSLYAWEIVPVAECDYDTWGDS